jgi:hypothetical protein
VGKRNGHTNSAALRAFVAMWTAEKGPDDEPRSKSDLCREAQITPGHMWDLETFRNKGTDPELRQRLADALGVPVQAITCQCARPNGVCLSAEVDS